MVLQRYLCHMAADEIPARDERETQGAVHAPYPALESARLKALAHPLRVQLLNALTNYGPATASGLAARLGESSGATSYHLRQLERHGFVQEDATQGTARERYWMRVPGPLTLDPTAYPPDSAERIAADAVADEWERERIRLLGTFLRYGPELLPHDWIESSGVMSSTLSLTREQLDELSEELGATVTRYVDRYRGQRGEGTRRVRIDVNAFPIIDRGEVDQ